MSSRPEARINKLVEGMRRDPILFIEKTTGKTPYWYQQEFIRAIRDERFVCGCWARQTGKSWSVRMAAIWFAFVFPNSFIMVVSCTEKQAYHFFSLLTKELRESEMLADSVEEDLKGSCKLTNGSQIISCAPSEKAVRGYSVDLLIIDEADRVPREVIVAAEATTVARHGSIVMISTPNIGGIGSIFYQYFTDGIESQRRGLPRGEKYGYKAFHHDYTVGLEVFRDEFIRGKKVKVSQLDPHYLKMKMNSMPDWEWKREYMAEWSDEVGTYFSDSVIEACIWDKNYRMQKVERAKGVIEYIGELPMRDYTYFAGMDFAKQIDKTVVSICRTMDDGRYKIVYFLEITGTDYPAQQSYIIEALKKYNVRKAWADRTGVGDAFIDYLTRVAYDVCDNLEKIEPIYLTNAKKAEIFGNAYPIVGNRLIQFPNHRQFITEMKMLKRDVTEEGNLKIHGPKEMMDINDDYPMAFALMMMCEIGGNRFSEPSINTVPKYSEQVRKEREENDFFGSKEYDDEYVSIINSVGSFVIGVGNRRKHRGYRGLF
ncbi:MAG: terminase large subunit domain-containing protein [Candidatus Hodarchaeales archaeon]